MGNDKYLKGKVAVVTGAGSSGFGRIMAKRFASKGADLVLNDIDKDGLEESKQIIQKEFDVKVKIINVDITDLNQVQKMEKEVFDSFDNVYLLVNNAGIDGGLYSSLKAKEEIYDKVMAVNVKGAWNMTKTFFRKMKRQRDFKPIRAKIINIASCAGTPNGLNPFIG
ncbi:MAG: SDR family oxidoreductase, partial [Promethearchaeota archaeon]